MSSYKLSTVLKGAHKSDVKGVSSFLNNVVTVSRDSQALLWTPGSLGEIDSWDTRILNATSNVKGYVNSLAVIEPCVSYPNGLIIFGAQDSKIYVVDPEKTHEEPLMILCGHSENVCTLTAAVIDSDLFIVSGSWDFTAKAWINGRLVSTLTDSSSSVWGVLLFEQTKSLITVSADKFISKYKLSSIAKTSQKPSNESSNGQDVEYTLEKRWQGHQSCIRAICHIKSSDALYATASNDGEIRIWSRTDEILCKSKGHTSFIYSLISLPNSDELASAGEGGEVRIWSVSNQQCLQRIQRIQLPCESVWSLCAMRNSDLVFGCSDSLAYIFSRSSQRQASEAKISKFNQEISSSIAVDQKTKTLSPEALNDPGKYIGEMKLILDPKSRESQVKIYQWNGTEYEFLGYQIVNDTRQEYMGKKYDFVFNVNIRDDQPDLKLPYNVGDDIGTTAQQFIETHQLPQAYLEDIIKFIEKNTDNATIQQLAPVKNPYADDYKSPSNCTDTTSSVSHEPRFNILPIKEFIAFTTINIPGAIKKLEEYQSSLNLPKQDLSLLEPLIQINKYKEIPSSLIAKVVPLCLKIASTWPISNRYPALDIIRILCLTDSTLQYSTLLSEISTSSCLFNYLENSSAESKEVAICRALGLKCVINCMQTKTGLAIIQHMIQELLSIVSNDDIFDANYLPLSETIATLLLNITVIWVKSPQNKNHDDLQLIKTIIINNLENSKNTYKCKHVLALALGNIMYITNERTLDEHVVSTLISIQDDNQSMTDFASLVSELLQSN